MKLSLPSAAVSLRASRQSSVVGRLDRMIHRFNMPPHLEAARTRDSGQARFSQGKHEDRLPRRRMTYVSTLESLRETRVASRGVIRRVPLIIAQSQRNGDCDAPAQKTR